MLHRSVLPLSPAGVARRFLEARFGFRLKSGGGEALEAVDGESVGGTIKRLRSGCSGPRLPTGVTSGGLLERQVCSDFCRTGYGDDSAKADLVCLMYSEQQSGSYLPFSLHRVTVSNLGDHHENDHPKFAWLLVGAGRIADALMGIPMSRSVRFGVFCTLPVGQPMIFFLLLPVSC